MKICILSLYKSENLGEMAYTECLRKIIEKRIPNVEIQLVDIHGRDATIPYKDNVLIKIFRKMNLNSLEKKIKFTQENRFLRKYYAERIRGAKAVIVPGGDILSVHQNQKTIDHTDIMTTFQLCQKYVVMKILVCTLMRWDTLLMEMNKKN